MWVQWRENRRHYEDVDHKVVGEILTDRRLPQKGGSKHSGQTQTAPDQNKSAQPEQVFLYEHGEDDVGPRRTSRAFQPTSQRIHNWFPTASPSHASARARTRKYVGEKVGVSAKDGSQHRQPSHGIDPQGSEPRQEGVGHTSPRIQKQITQSTGAASHGPDRPNGEHRRGW